MSNDDLYRKVQSLLTLAERSTNQHEAAVAASMAAKLIEKYNLDADAIRDWKKIAISHERVYLRQYMPDEWKVRKPRKQPYLYGRKRQYSPRGWPPPAWYEYGQVDWFVSLSVAIGSVCGCEAAYFSPGAVTYVGEAEKVKQAAFLLGNLFYRLLTMANQAVKDYAVSYKAEHGVSPWREYGRVHPSHYRVGWIEGAAGEIATKLYDQAHAAYMARREAERTNRATQEKNHNALVAVQSAVESYKLAHFSRVTKTLDEKETMGSYEGWEAGRKANLGIQAGLGRDGATGLLKPASDEQGIT